MEEFKQMGDRRNGVTVRRQLGLVEEDVGVSEGLREVASLGAGLEVEKLKKLRCGGCRIVGMAGEHLDDEDDAEDDAEDDEAPGAKHPPILRFRKRVSGEL